MKILITGAAGRVGAILWPQLAAVHDCTFYDLRAVPGAARTIIGDVLSVEAMTEATAGMDAVIQLVMAPPVATPESHYAVHVRGMATVLEAVANNHIPRVIYASTMSIYRHTKDRGFGAEDEQCPNALDRYGLTKWLGEQVCRAFCNVHDWLSVIALRMVHPLSEEQWASRPSDASTYVTGPKDLGRLYLAALSLEDHRGFTPIHACSDGSGKHLKMDRAREVLGWVPAQE